MSEERLKQLRQQVRALYAGYGITTIQDANVGLSYVQMWMSQSYNQGPLQAGALVLEQSTNVVN